MTTHLRSTLFLFSLLGFMILHGFAQLPHPLIDSGYTPQRVWNASTKQYSDFEAMLAELARAEVVFVGEQHDDPATHRLERAVLEGLLRRRGTSVVVAMEMFERDVQPVLDAYLTGRLTEEEFLKQSRPWPRYATDYRGLVEIARTHNWRVIASNTPRRLAREVSKGGLAVVEQWPPADRALVAQHLSCPMDDYFKRFAETMNEHPGAGAPGSAKESKETENENKAMIEKFYFAQCVKDETMGESVAAASQNATGSHPVVVHFNGAFHSDYHLGTAARAQRRLPQASVKVVSIIPVEDLDMINPDEYRQRGDYLIFTNKPKEVKSAK